MKVRVVGDEQLLEPYANPNGIASLQVWTESMPGRPFPAWTVVAEVYTGGAKPVLRLTEFARDLVTVEDDAQHREEETP